MHIQCLTFKLTSLTITRNLKRQIYQDSINISSRIGIKTILAIVPTCAHPIHKNFSPLPSLERIHFPKMSPTIEDRVIKTSHTFIPNFGNKSRQSQVPRPSYFIVRPTGEIVPLVAVDEFPPGINIVGIPRMLHIDMTEGMLNLGIRKRHGGTYQISDGRPELEAGQLSREKSRQPSLVEDDNVNADVEGNIALQTPRAQANSSNDLPSMRQPMMLDRQSIQHNVHVRSPVQRPLCRHWCIHGVCRWGRRCRYKHVMPKTVSGLLEVGLQEWPAWFRSLYPGYVVAASSGIDEETQPVASNVTRERENVMEAGRGTNKSILDAGQRVLKTLKVRDAEREKEKQKREVRGRERTLTLESVSRRSAEEWADERDNDVEDNPTQSSATANVKEKRDGGKLVDI